MRTRGFTLVELMVVVTVIAILMTIAYAAFGESRKVARDNIRKTDLQNLKVAIELYKQENGVYPEPGCGVVSYEAADPNWSGSESVYTSSSVEPCVDEYIEGLAPNFIAVLPTEPSSDTDNKGYTYTSNSARTEYKVLAHSSVESLFITDGRDALARCMSATGVCAGGIPPDTYAVYSSGAINW